jgi:hypothetical protein
MISLACGLFRAISPAASRNFSNSYLNIYLEKQGRVEAARHDRSKSALV